jgi:hypothetical protein
MKEFKSTCMSAPISMPLDTNVESPRDAIIFASRESYPNPVIQCLTLLDRPTFGEVHSDGKLKRWK